MLTLDEICECGDIYMPEIDLSQFEVDELRDSGDERYVDAYLLRQVNGIEVRWVLLEVIASKEDLGPAEVRRLMNGLGFSGALRESRHTYIGEEGYVFYIKPYQFMWAWKLLTRDFDLELS